MSSASIDIAFSPCPNDTFMFYAWVHKKVGQHLPCSSHLFDIQTLNEKRFPLKKSSVATAFNQSENYSILSTGAALGFGCGPLVVGKKPLRKVAIPGKGTVANLLFDLFVPDCEKVYTTYDKIFSLIESGEVDGGVIIHESRFIYQQRGHSLLYDLGALWEKIHHLPLPLGVLLLEKGQDPLTVTRIIQASLQYAYSHKDDAFPYIQMLSQEKDRDIINQHIDLYVNSESYQLSSVGRKAIETLYNASLKRGLLHEKASLSFCHDS